MTNMHTRYVIGRFSVLVATAAVAMVWCGVTLLATPAARATTGIIISDGFSGIDGTTIDGRTPDSTPATAVDLPGGTWFSKDVVNAGNNPFGSHPVISGNTAMMNANSSAFISLQSTGGYTKPTLFVISGDIEVDTTAVLGSKSLGMGLGFSSTNNVFDVSQEISLAINGDLNFAQNLIAAYNPADFGNHAFNPLSFYHLQYTVNTVTGGISDIVLSNNQGSQSYTVSTNVFNNANTAYAGIFSNSGAGGTHGFIDNFVVVAPEPASMALLAGGSLLLLRRRRA